MWISWSIAITSSGKIIFLAVPCNPKFTYSVVRNCMVRGAWLLQFAAVRVVMLRALPGADSFGVSYR